MRAGAEVDMIFDKIKAMIAQQTGVDESKITMQSDILKDIGLDSLDIVELIMNAEEEWNIIIDDEDVASFKTIADVVAYIESKI